jgi:hypothetical protein
LILLLEFLAFLGKRRAVVLLATGFGSSADAAR